MGLSERRRIKQLVEERVPEFARRFHQETGLSIAVSVDVDSLDNAVIERPVYTAGYEFEPVSQHRQDAINTARKAVASADAKHACTGRIAAGRR